MSLDSQNPTGSTDSGASNADPVERIEAWLNAGDGDSTNQATDVKPDAPDDKPADPDTPDKDAPAKDSEPQITTAQLAAFLDIEESDIEVNEDGKPVFKTKIDGKESSAKFADLRKTHQLSGHAENRAREAAAKEQAAAARMQEADQAIQAKFQHIEQSLAQVNQLAAVAQEELKGEYQSINWDALWKQDPAQARGLERQFEQRAARIQGVFQTLAQRQQQAAQAAQWERGKAEEARVQAEKKALGEEAQRLTELIPEWRDQAVASKEMQELRTWALGLGYTPEELDGFKKAHHVKALRSAWQHATLQQSKPATEAKVRTAPKLVKPGQAPVNEGNAGTLKSLKQQVRSANGGNSTKALAAWLEAAGKA